MREPLNVALAMALLHRVASIHQSIVLSLFVSRVISTCPHATSTLVCYTRARARARSETCFAATLKLRYCILRAICFFVINSLRTGGIHKFRSAALTRTPPRKVACFLHPLLKAFRACTCRRYYLLVRSSARVRIKLPTAH